MTGGPGLWIVGLPVEGEMPDSPRAAPKTGAVQTTTQMKCNKTTCEGPSHGLPPGPPAGGGLPRPRGSREGAAAPQHAPHVGLLSHGFKGHGLIGQLLRL